MNDLVKTSGVTGVLLFVLTTVFVLSLVGGWVYHGWTMRQWAADRD